MKGEKIKDGCLLDAVPFSVVTELFRDLRKIRVGNRKRPRSILDQNQSHPGKYSRLLRFWLDVAEFCGLSRDLFVQHRSDVALIPAHILPPETSFKLISLIIPALDSRHTYMGMKETRLAETVCKSLDLGASSEYSLWLKNYRDKAYRPNKWNLSSEVLDGSFPSVLKAVLDGRCPTESTLMIGDVWNALDIISQTSISSFRRISRISDRSTRRGLSSTSKENKENGSVEKDEKSDAERRIAIFRKIIQAGTAEEVTDFARVLLKDTDVQVSQDNFFGWFHPSAKQHYDQSHDLQKLLQDCHDPKFEIGDVSVQVGFYASVMLTQRPSRKALPEICAKLCGLGDGKGPLRPENEIEEELSISASRPPSIDESNAYFQIEPKLDGERMQLHMQWTQDLESNEKKCELYTFSRRGNNSSAMYVEALENVAEQSIRAEAVILDGEIMIRDQVRNCWIPFERFRDVATNISQNSVPPGESYVLQFMVFDVLYVDQGKKVDEMQSSRAPNMVVRLPFHKRRELLEQIVQKKEYDNGPGLKSAIEVIRCERGQNEDHLTSSLQRCVTFGYEGIVAKNPDMPYALAQRNANLGIKLKPDYFDGGLQDVDVLILGGRLSSSKHRAGRAGNISTFLVGVRDDTFEANGLLSGQKRPETWIPVGSVGTGYSDQELERLRNVLAGHWHNFDSKHLPDHFSKREYGKSLFNDVTKWIEPSRSVVVTVRAYELNRGYCGLRFPRVEKIHWEKPYHDTITFTELLDLDEHKAPAIVRPDEDDIDDVPLDYGGKGREPQKKDEESEAVARAEAEGYIVAGGRTSRAVIGTARGASVNGVPVLSNALLSITFLVIALERNAKEKVEIQIHELGGRFVQNLTDKVDYIVGIDREHAVLDRYIKQFEANSSALNARPIVKEDWIKKIHDKKELVPLRWNDVYFAPVDLQRELLKDGDRFGDTWDTEISANEILSAIERTNIGGPYKECADSIANEHIDNALRTAGWVFRGMKFCVAEQNNPPFGAACLLEMFGAQRSDELCDENCYVLLSDTNAHLQRTSTIVEGMNRHVENAANRVWGNGSGNHKTITDAWVRSCVGEKKLLPNTGE